MMVREVKIMDGKKKTSIYEVPKLTIVLVDDIDEWKCDIKEDIELGIDDYEFDFISFSSLPELDTYINQSENSFILVMDLQLEQNIPGFDGLTWTLSNYSDIIKRKLVYSVFIISGHLDEQLSNLLQLYGIPNDHIYSKANWAEESDNFVKSLHHIVDTLGVVNSSEKHNLRKYHFEKIDPYLRNKFSNSLNSSDDNLNMFSFLINAGSYNLNESNIDGLQLLGKIGKIDICVGTQQAILDLSNISEVSYIEGSKVAQGFEKNEVSSNQIITRNKLLNDFEEDFGANVIFGFIENEFKIDHECINIGNIEAIWDQSSNREYRNLNEIITYQNSKKKFSEMHGTSILSIVVGKETEGFQGGIAPEAKAILVIPDLEKLDFDASYGLAIQYLYDLSKQIGKPLVINLSQGVNLGSHDGKSLLEKGITDLTSNGAEMGIVVVKSAGNLRKEKLHATLELSNYCNDELTWHSEVGSDDSDNIQLWFDPASDYRFQLEDPFGNRSKVYGCIESYEYCHGEFSSGYVYSIIYEKRNRLTGDSLFSINIKPLEGHDISSSDWKLYISSGMIRANSSIIHAWAEKPKKNSLSKNRPMFSFTSHADESVTLTIPGTAESVLTVGSVQIERQSKRESSFSSRGPTRKERVKNKPEICAPGENLLVASLNQKTKYEIVSGTSYSAAIVSGYIGLLLSYNHRRKNKLSSNGLNLEIIRGAINTSPTDYNGYWTSSMGFGVMNFLNFYSDLKDF